ncbi:hypothetical protein [Flavisolibacter nicotianae]|uniref:hypothetical protein n=1 Tax=Flavisolibacter nicotianae TaxID=2364882 RepID=UPI000EACE7A1|nr:hypothetical protein [Flavisolibacter nicotianae]
MESKTAVDLEKDLISHLAAANMTKEQLSELSKSIAASVGSGFKIVDWWILGIPAFEQVIIQAHVPIAETNTLNKLILNERFKGIDILRKGIPKPDFFQVKLTIQNIRSQMPQV